MTVVTVEQALTALVVALLVPLFAIQYVEMVLFCGAKIVMIKRMEDVLLIVQMRSLVFIALEEIG